MGNFLGLGKKDEFILDFEGVRTDVSSTIPYMNKLNSNAQLLANRLNSKVMVSQKEFNESENYDMYKLFEKTQSLDNNNNNFSDTSPFISSDVYKNLINTQKGGNMDDDISSTESSNSSSSSSSSEKPRSKKGKASGKASKKSSKKSSKSAKKSKKSSEKAAPVKSSSKHSKKSRKNKGKEMSEDISEESSTSEDRTNKGKKDKKNKNHDMDDDDEEIVVEEEVDSLSTDEEIDNVISDTMDDISVGGASYLSSSDHDDKNNKYKNRLLSDSINTSDINMISVEE